MQSVIATWPFSRCGIEAAKASLSKSNDAITAVEVGIKAVELDPSVTSAGYGGLPNASGDLELDAALMTSDGRTGAVMALHDHQSAITPARYVMERCNHAILSGEGAKQFAKDQGLHQSDNLLTEHAKRRYEAYLQEESTGNTTKTEQGIDDEKMMPHTDTVGMIARDSTGLIVAGCATSGMQFKHPGRVGDSPVFGAGLYADIAGAAVASGDGDTMLRFCMSFLAVERMRQGDNAEYACEYVVRRVREANPNCQAAIAAMDRNGCTGAACIYGGFTTMEWSVDSSQDVVMKMVPGQTGNSWLHSCV